MSVDYYQLLAVAEDASPEEIRRAYYAMVRRYPPEKEPERFMALREAYEALSDPETRNEYDAIRGIWDLGVRADQHFDMEEWDKAAVLYRQATELAPDLPYFRVRLGLSLYLDKRLVEAAEVFERLTQQHPDEPEQWKMLGLVLFKQARSLAEPDTVEQTALLQRARNAYLRAIELAPDDSEAHRGLADVHIFRAEWDEARLNLEAALDNPSQDMPKLVATLMTLLDVALLEEHESTDLWALARETNSRDTSALDSLPLSDAVVRRMVGTLQTADTNLRDAAVTSLLTTASEMMGREIHSVALLKIEAALRIDPNHAEAHRLLAECRASLGANEARSTYDAGRDAFSLEARADQHFEAEEWDKAAELYGQAAQLVPERLQLRELEAMSLFYGGRLIEATRVLQQITRQNPSEAEYWKDLGRVLCARATEWAESETRERARLLEQARDAYQKAIELAPHDPEAYRGLAEACVHGAEWEEARLNLETALGIPGQDVVTRVEMLLRLFRVTLMQEHEGPRDLWVVARDARAQDRMALDRLSSLDAVARRIVGTVAEGGADVRQQALGRLLAMAEATPFHTSAVFYLEAALRIDPNHSKANQLLAERGAALSTKTGPQTVAKGRPGPWWIVLVCVLIGGGIGEEGGLFVGFLVGLWMRSNWSRFAVTDPPQSSEN